MKIDIMDVDKFVKLNELKEITNPIFFDRGAYPTEDGLFSFEIFGRSGSYDRKTVYAYIDLKDYFLHPLVYKNIIRLNRKIEELVSGISYFKLTEDGDLEKVENEEEGKTGLKFLYDNWNKINFKPTDSNKRDERIDLIKALKRNEAFITKQIVMPAFYRDKNFADENNKRIDPINDLYAKIIRLVKALEENNNSGIDFVLNGTKSTIQSKIVEIFDYTIGLTKKKDGLFRQAVMGKSIDYSCRNVLSEASFFDKNTYKDMDADMTHTGVPLATVINIFCPFIIKWITDFFERTFESNKIVVMNKNKKKENGEVEVTEEVISQKIYDMYSYDAIKEKIHLFTKAPSERFERVPIPLENGKVLNASYIGSMYNPNDEKSIDSSIVGRDLTWTDLFYQAAVNVCEDKYVYITRYPLEDYFNIYPSKVNVLSTFKTQPQYIEGKYYPKYPVIDLKLDKEDIRGLFVDSLQVYNAYLNGLGGDFDGDMVTIRGCFTQEANKETEQILMSPSNVLNIIGKNNREVSMECVQTLYDLTKV